MKRTHLATALIGTLAVLLAAGCDAKPSPPQLRFGSPVKSLAITPGDAGEAERILFAETTTFGIRRRVCRRRKLRRVWETVETPYGPIRVKVGRLDEATITASPEFSDCAAAAQAHHVSVKEVLGAAEAAYHQLRSE